ncbi:MAG: TonB-dependent receptor [Acidobacteria bacterium]|nr:TonB-dependent receptor [Acidobacteriota bacterium]
MRKAITFVFCFMLFQLALAETAPAHKPKEQKEKKKQEHVSETVVVTADLHKQETFDTRLPVNALTAEQLKLTVPSNFIDLLNTTPGVTVSQTGSGSVRPMIRGLYDERVLTLMNGIRQGEQFGGGNHTYSIEPGMIQNVEIVRGPASVIYGTDAIGGVLNFFTKGYGMGRMPENSFSTLYRSAVDGNRQSLFYGDGSDKWKGFLDVVRKDFNDIETPDGKLRNSGTKGIFYNTGINYADDNHQFILNYYAMQADIGIPVNPDAVDMGFKNNEYKRFQAMYEWTDISPVIRGIRVTAATQYKHRHMFIELPVDTGHNKTMEIFLNKVTRNINAHTHLLLGNHLLTTGANLFNENAWSSRRLGTRTLADRRWDTQLAAGVIPPSDRTGIGAFVQDEWSNTDSLDITAGFRVDRVKSRAPFTAGYSYSGVSHTDSHATGTLGILYHLGTNTNVFGNFGTAFRSPSLLERFFYGVHQDSVDIGNPGLVPEIGQNIDFGIRTRGSWYSLALSLFHNRINHYIAELKTGETDPETGLEIHTWSNLSRITLKGGELEGQVWLSDIVSYRGSVSLVHGTDNVTGDDLPDMPPVKIVNEITLKGLNRPGNSRSWAKFSVLTILRQNRIATFETETAGYTVFNLFAGLNWKNTSIELAARNLTDKSYHDHLSRVHYMNEQPGRSIDLNITWHF